MLYAWANIVVKTTQIGGTALIKTALFETLIDSAVKNDDGSYTFTLEGIHYQISDTLEISKIAQDHGYIIIY